MHRTLSPHSRPHARPAGRDTHSTAPHVLPLLWLRGPRVRARRGAGMRGDGGRGAGAGGAVNAGFRARRPALRPARPSRSPGASRGQGLVWGVRARGQTTRPPPIPRPSSSAALPASRPPASPASPGPWSISPATRPRPCACSSSTCASSRKPRTTCLSRSKCLSSTSSTRTKCTSCGRDWGGKKEKKARPSPPFLFPL